MIKYIVWGVILVSLSLAIIALSISNVARSSITKVTLNINDKSEVVMQYYSYKSVRAKWERICDEPFPIYIKQFYESVNIKIANNLILVNEKVYGCIVKNYLDLAENVAKLQEIEYIMMYGRPSDVRIYKYLSTMKNLRAVVIYSPTMIDLIMLNRKCPSIELLDVNCEMWSCNYNIDDFRELKYISIRGRYGRNAFEEMHRNRKVVKYINIPVAELAILMRNWEYGGDIGVYIHKTEQLSALNTTLARSDVRDKLDIYINLPFMQIDKQVARFAIFVKIIYRGHDKYYDIKDKLSMDLSYDNLIVVWIFEGQAESKDIYREFTYDDDKELVLTNTTIKATPYLFANIYDFRETIHIYSVMIDIKELCMDDVNIMKCQPEIKELHIYGENGNDVIIAVIKKVENITHLIIDKELNEDDLEKVCESISRDCKLTVRTKANVEILRNLNPIRLVIHYTGNIYALLENEDIIRQCYCVTIDNSDLIEKLCKYENIRAYYINIDCEFNLQRISMIANKFLIIDDRIDYDDDEYNYDDDEERVFRNIFRLGVIHIRTNTCFISILVSDKSKMAAENIIYIKGGLAASAIFDCIYAKQVTISGYLVNDWAIVDMGEGLGLYSCYEFITSLLIGGNIKSIASGAKNIIARQSDGLYETSLFEWSSKINEIEYYFDNSYIDYYEEFYSKTCMYSSYF